MPKTIIFANGDPPSRELLRYIAADDIIMCANGGTLHALGLGLTPHTIVGDLDSLPDEIKARMERAGVEMISKPARKDETDLECALRVAIERGAGNILIAAALGGRLDQMLGNLLLLGRQEWRSANIRLVQDDQMAWVLRGPVQCDINGAPGDTVSILPLTKIVDGVYLTGVEWEVSNDAFSFGSTRPISNALTGTHAGVTIGSGVCLVIHIPAQSRP